MPRIGPGYGQTLLRASVRAAIGLSAIYCYETHFKKFNADLAVTPQLALDKISQEARKEALKGKYVFKPVKHLSKDEILKAFGEENLTECPPNRNFPAGFSIKNIKNPLACTVIEDRILNRVEAYERFIKNRRNENDPDVQGAVEQIKFCLRLEKETMIKKILYEAIEKTKK